MPPWPLASVVLVAALAAARPTPTHTPTMTPTPTPTATATATARPTPTPTATPIPGGPIRRGSACGPGQTPIVEDAPFVGTLCFPTDVFAAFVFGEIRPGLAGAVEAVTDPALSALTFSPDLTSPAYAPLQAYQLRLLPLVNVFFGIGMLLRVLMALPEMVRRGAVAVAAGVLWRTFLAALFVDAVTTGLHAWFLVVGAVVEALNGPRTAALARTVVQMLDWNNASTAGGVLGAAGALVLLAILLALVLWILWKRMEGLFLLGFYFLVAPLCVAVWAWPGGERIGKWWGRGFTAYSLYAAVYAGIIQAAQMLVFGFPASGDAIFSNVIVRLMLFVAAIGVLREVPKIVHRIAG